MNDLVSVIIPTYNSEAYIVDAIDSVFSQKYSNIEVIIVDDGSTDRTARVLKPYLNRIKYILKENGGPASARNVGIRNASGRYIAFLDADDIWEHNKLEHQMKAFVYDSVGLVYSDIYRVDAKNSHVLPRVEKKRFSGRIFKELFWNNFIPTSSVVLCRECLKKVGSFNEREDFISTEDYDLWLRIAAACDVVYVDRPLVRYRMHSKKISGIIDRSYSREKNVLESIANDMRHEFSFIDKDWNRRLAVLHYNWAFDYFTAGEYGEAKKYFKKSLTFNSLNGKAWIYLCSIFLGEGWIDFCRNFKRKLRRT